MIHQNSDIILRVGAKALALDGAPLAGALEGMADTPAETDLSRALPADLRRRAFKFVGPVICYSYLQAAGLVNDHLLTRLRHNSCMVGEATK